ncbi:MAG: hypothetical protein HRT70_09145 [Flavobacteriaceae bacterium]|nr:hypothetical protein [Flavobacteriaceae bacterium]
MTIKLVLILAAISSSIALAEDRGALIDYSTTLKASDVATLFFGPAAEPKSKRVGINVGRIAISAKTRLSCGKIDVVGSVKGELNKIDQQLRAAVSEIESIITNPAALAMGAVCYYKPNVCSHIRHLSVLLNEAINLQFEACQAIDKYIDDQADKGLKQRHAKAVEECLAGKDLTTENIRACHSRSARSRNLLAPFEMRYATGRQKVLESIMEVVKKSENYTLWSRILGEVEMKSNGYWVKLFPDDMLRPDDVTNNFLSSARSESCDINKLERIITNTESPTDDDFGKYVRDVIKARVPIEVVKDLRSIPLEDQKMACSALGEAIAEIAVKRMVSDGKSSMSSALSNGALPDDLRVFYRERSEETTQAILAKIESEQIKPLKEVIGYLAQLGLEYRDLNRNTATGVQAKKLFNKDRASSRKCEDALSCGG